MAAIWYIRRRRRIEGPLSDKELREAALAGALTPQTLVSQNRHSGWVEARRIASLKFGTADTAARTPLLLSAVNQTAARLPRRKTWIALVAGAASVLVIVLSVSRRDAVAPITAVDHTAPVQAADIHPAASPKAAAKSPPDRLITQRWQRKWLKEH